MIAILLPVLLLVLTFLVPASCFWSGFPSGPATGFRLPASGFQLLVRSSPVSLDYFESLPYIYIALFASFCHLYADLYADRRRTEETRRNKKKQEETIRNKQKQEETRRNKQRGYMRPGASECSSRYTPAIRRTLFDGSLAMLRIRSPDGAVSKTTYTPAYTPYIYIYIYI